MLRLFVAVWPPEAVLDTLDALARPQVDGLRWTARDQWHVTLRFLGPVEATEPVLAALSEAPAVAPTSAEMGPAVARFGQRVLHVPVTGLAELAASVIAATAHIGRPPDDRPFHGHITLARVANRARVDLRPLTGTAVTGRWPVESVCLVRSHLRSTGARYEVVERVTPPRPQPGDSQGEPAPRPDGGPHLTS
jgi:RNA 2',3'-cyclic 3'-phosphodiesterase